MGAFYFTDFSLARVAVPSKPPAMQADDNLLYKTTLPPDIDDCSGRQESEKEGWWSAMANKAYSLSHTKWMCKYHIVFTPKYRRKAIFGQIRFDIGGGS